MVVRKRKKNRNQRGNTWHGWGKGKGHHKKSGNRGGFGMAGTGKRADHRKPSIWGERYFGKVGFKKKGQLIDIVPINIDMLEERIMEFTEQKLITKEKDTYVVDLSKLGYNKLLGSGTPKNKWKITTRFASHNAIEKVKEAGGEVITPKAAPAEGN